MPSRIRCRLPAPLRIRTLRTTPGPSPGCVVQAACALASAPADPSGPVRPRRTRVELWWLCPVCSLANAGCMACSSPRRCSAAGASNACPTPWRRGPSLPQCGVPGRDRAQPAVVLQRRGETTDPRTSRPNPGPDREPAGRRGPGVGQAFRRTGEVPPPLRRLGRLQNLASAGRSLHATGAACGRRVRSGPA